MKQIKTSPIHIVVAVSVAGLAGCAIKTPQSAISHWPVEKRASYYAEPMPYRVAVVTLADHRPDNEHQGQQPRGLFLLLWNRRSGDYYTSDDAFAGNVPAQLSERLTAYLQSANAFTDATLVRVPSDGFDILDRSQVRTIGERQHVDYVLGGELKHFFGSQNQQFQMIMLPLYFANTFSWRNGKSLPWGKTTALLVLCDARSGEVVWRHELEASETLPTDKSMMTDAAMESFLSISNQLVAEVRQLPLNTVEPTQPSPQPTMPDIIDQTESLPSPDET